MATMRFWLGGAAGGVVGLSALATPVQSPLEARFTKELWPVLQAQCAPCHAKRNPSQFLLPTDPHTAFLKLLGEGQLAPDNHAGIVYRITTTDKTILMPPVSFGKLTPAQVTTFDHFGEAVQQQRASSGAKPDEVFPPHLTIPFKGKLKPAQDNTFLTFRQLRGKTQTIFGDDGTREERNLFLDHVALFQGADFVKRFDESSKASPTFLTGLDLVGRELASKAYLNRTGPFAGFTDTTTPTEGIGRLYNRMLFRDPTPTERTQAETLLKSIAAAAPRPSDLRFALAVTDEAGLTVTKELSVALRDETRALTTVYVDQEAGEEPVQRLGTFTLAPGAVGQQVVLTNAETYGNVSVEGLTLVAPDGTRRKLGVRDPGVVIEGAWKLGAGFAEDNNENKGASHLTFPLTVEKAGTYEVLFHWRRAKAARPNAKGKNLAPSSLCRDLCVQVYSADSTSQIATPPAPPVPPKGEAHFSIDQSIDTRAHADLRSSFRFGASGGVEIRNEGTAKRVVADAVRLFEGKSETPLLLRASSAQGKAAWARFPAENFNPYNTVGPDLLQDLGADNQKKPLTLTFPAATAGTSYDPRRFYRPAIVYPGKADNETRVPIVVKAEASSPIVQLAAPLAARAGATITLDASGSYNLQHTPLRFRWTQIGGPRVAVANPSAPTLTVTVPKLTGQQAAWEGLCRALMAHPDYLFTRPRSLATTTDPKTRRRLQLVKLAQDLVGRTPSTAEVAQLDSGASLASLVDRYLASKEFVDFYFHRTRLYLESHGTPEQDEPARLWTWILTQNRPFQEILTADYTVDTQFQKQARPAYHGKTGVLTMKGFLQGKPSLPHFNYSAQVCQKFLGYVFEVPDEIVQARQGITASATTDPNSVCYTCHKVLTPLAYQRAHWDDDGNYRAHDELGLPIDDSDRGEVASYAFKGEGMEAFATQAANKERFVRTILQTHFVWYFGRELRCEADERGLYQRLWSTTKKSKHALKPLIRAIVLSPEYLTK